MPLSACTYSFHLPPASHHLKHCLHHNFLFSHIRCVSSNQRKMEPASTSSSAGNAVAETPTRRKKQSRPLQFGSTQVIKPKGKHEATVVWLHGLGDTCAGWTQALEMLPLRNIKWIVPTAPIQPVAVFGGVPCTAWFDVGSLSEDANDDLEGLDSAASHIADLFSNEQPNIKLAIGGFSQGAATALYTMTRSITGEFSSGDPFPLKFSAAVAISGWLPCAKSLKEHLGKTEHAQKQAENMPLLLCHGTADDIVQYKHGEKSAAALQSAGFKNLSFKTYKGLGHYTCPEEINDIGAFLRSSLNLKE